MRFYQGYGFDDTGMTVWPSKKYKFRWEHLTRCFTHVETRDNVNFSYSTELEFSNGKTTLAYSRFLSTKRFVRFASCIKQIAEASKNKIIMCSITCRIAAWEEYEAEYQRAKNTCKDAPFIPSINLALAHWVRLEMKQARNVMDAFLELYQKNISALILRADIEDEITQDPKKGLMFRKKALTLDPDNIALLSSFGYQYISEKKYDQALNVLKHMTSVHGEAPQVYQIWGHYFFEQGKINEAETELNKAIQLEKNNLVKAHYQRILDHYERYESDVRYRRKTIFRTKVLPWIIPSAIGMYFVFMIISYIVNIFK